jgi:hypothetical protein
LELVTDKWNEWRMVVDEDVDASIAASNIGPWADLVEEMIAEGHFRMGARFEEVGKRAQNAGCKERDQQDDRAWQSEPAGSQTGEE